MQAHSTVASSTDAARVLDERQYEFDDGSRSALNCYSTTLGAFSPEIVASVERHAESLSRILRLALRLRTEDPYPEHLRTALESRTVIDTAVGIIMAQNRCGRSAAFQILVNASSHRNIKLRSVAERVIAHVAGDHDIPAVFEE